MRNAQTKPWWRGSRGEWYVLGQLALMALVFFGPRSSVGLPAWPEVARLPSRVVGIGLLVGGLGLLIAGALRLGPNLTPLPFPKDGATLFQSGAFGIVRHPMYGGGAGIAVGWALAVHGWLTLLYAVLLIVFLDIKATREEQWLVEVYPQYREYQRRVPKLLPFLR